MRSAPPLTEVTQTNNDNNNNNNDTTTESLFAICKKSKVIWYSSETSFKDTHTVSHIPPPPPLFGWFFVLFFLSMLYVEHGA